MKTFTDEIDHLYAQQNKIKKRKSCDNHVKFRLKIISKQCRFTLIKRVIARQQNDKKQNQFGRARSTYYEGVCNIHMYFTISYCLRTSMTTIIIISTKMYYIWHHHFIVCIFFNCNLFKMECTFHWLCGVCGVCVCADTAQYMHAQCANVCIALFIISSVHRFKSTYKMQL